MRPSHLRIDVSSRCQLRCPVCPRTMGLTRRSVGDGFLRARDLSGLLRRNPWVEVVEFAAHGEPFLNPELPRILGIAGRHGLYVTFDAGTNLNRLDDGLVDALVRHRVAKVRCSIDGATEETYRKYRVGGSLETVLENVRRINRCKARRRSAFPALVWQFIVFGHNEREIPAARALARGLGMGFELKLNHSPSYSPVRGLGRLRREPGLRAATRQEYERRRGRPYLADVCGQLWDFPQIGWDGRILGCCWNHWGAFGGNAFRDDLEEALDGEKLRYARGMLLGRLPARADVPCASCDRYRAMRRRGRWLRSPSAVRWAAERA